jgi:hypothetical protein
MVVEELTADVMVPVVVPEMEKQKARDEELRLQRAAVQEPPRLTPPDLGTPLPPPLTRYYVVIGRNGGRRGALTPRLAIALRPAPPAPSQLTSTLAESYIELGWAPPEGLPQPVHKGTAVARPPATAKPQAAPVAPPPAPAAPPAAPVAPPASPAPAPAATPPAPVAPPPAPAATPPVAPVTPAAPAAAPGAPAAEAAVPALLNSRSLTGFPTPTVGYSVYEVAPPQAPPPPPALQPNAVPALPRRATMTPVATTTWRDAKVELGTVRCYAVRTVVTLGTPVESEQSPVLCVSPTDTFPPKAPTSLAAVASEGAISLIWEANTEEDLGGYIVLRGPATGAPMRPLMTAPIKETTFRDTTVQADVRYVYAVVAVDTATPPNVSSQSNRVEETAR